jgi:hypothetical protein
MVCAVLVCALAALTAPAAATSVRIRHVFFGTHDRSGVSYTAIQEGSVRLWDVGVRWDKVETVRRGHYDWTALDALVTDAQAAHAEVTMVVAMTPGFYASDPTKPPTDITAYKSFVQALMQRYRTFQGQRGISAYQVWNEGNVPQYWTGTPAELAALTRAMWQVRNQWDPQAKVIAPPMVTRTPSELDAMTAYDAQRVNGVPVWKYVDAVALSLYPLPTYGQRTGVPEDSMRILHEVRARLRGLGAPADEPVWATEINYGLPTGNGPDLGADPISTARQEANVARTYLLSAAHGISRVFWYRYDMSHLLPEQGGGVRGNTLLSDPDDPTQVTAAGRAYVRVQRWMHGRLVGPRHRHPCQRDVHGTYTCKIIDGNRIRRIYWNPFTRAKVRLAPKARRAQSISGGVRTVEGGSRITVGFLPVMVHH